MLQQAGIHEAEAWRAISGFEGKYEVSDRGRVRSLWFKGKPRAEPKVLKTPPDGAGYPRVGLFSSDGKRRGVTVHILVAQAFLGARPAGLIVNHRDGDRQNNAASNLEYLTSAENTQHAFRTGLAKPAKGSYHGQAKLVESDIPVIRKMVQWLPYREVADRFGVTAANISYIVAGKAWSHVP